MVVNHRVQNRSSTSVLTAEYTFDARPPVDAGYCDSPRCFEKLGYKYLRATWRRQTSGGKRIYRSTNGCGPKSLASGGYRNGAVISRTSYRAEIYISLSCEVKMVQWRPNKVVTREQRRMARNEQLSWGFTTLRRVRGEIYASHGNHKKTGSCV